VTRGSSTSHGALVDALYELPRLGVLSKTKPEQNDR
jgi:hypothetical protein